jgi:hypothetical protein
MERIDGPDDLFEWCRKCIQAWAASRQRLQYAPCPHCFKPLEPRDPSVILQLPKRPTLLEMLTPHGPEEYAQLARLVLMYLSLYLVVPWNALVQIGSMVFLSLLFSVLLHIRMIIRVYGLLQGDVRVIDWHLLYISWLITLWFSFHLCILVCTWLPRSASQWLPCTWTHLCKSYFGDDNLPQYKR